ncbi:hypothetical protein [Orenia marismortui]|uniref:hypothetical protein n=1 Tax=Orenia marismortui TaxID=46469 RepID=UPI00036B02AD|nr:hypothetical protein [Orenia marismortui]
MQKDKVLHFIVGTVIVLLCLLVQLPIIVTLVLLVAAAAGKEVYDYHHPQSHQVETYDILATIAGGLFILLLYYGVV